MGFHIENIISIKVFTSEACERVKAIDLEEFGFTGPLLNKNNSFSYSGTTGDPTDGYGLIQALASALDGEGKAFVTNICVEDIAGACTYFYLGDGIKAAYFSSGDDEDIYSYEARYAALCRFNSEELREIYKEIMEVDEFPDYLENDDDYCREIINNTAQDYLYEPGTNLFTSPYLAKVLEVIEDNSKKARLDDEDLQLFDYEPRIDWEEKGFYTFSKIEREFLKK